MCLPLVLLLTAPTGSTVRRLLRTLAYVRVRAFKLLAEWKGRDGSERITRTSELLYWRITLAPVALSKSFALSCCFVCSWIGEVLHSGSAHTINGKRRLQELEMEQRSVLKLSNAFH